MIKRYPGGRFSSLLGNEIVTTFSAAADRAVRGVSPAAVRAADPDDRRRLGDGAGAVRAAPAGRRGLRSGRCASSTARARSATCSRWRRSARWVKADADFRSGRRRRIRPRGGRRVPGGGELGGLDVYMCGPPPMLEAAEQMLARAAGARPHLPGPVHDLGRRRPPRPRRPAAARGASPNASSAGLPPPDAGPRSTRTSPSTPSRRSTATCAADGRSASRTGAAPGTTPRPRCAAGTGSRSATRARTGSGPSTRPAPRSSSRSRARSPRPPSRACSTTSPPPGSLPARHAPGAGVRGARPLVRAGHRRPRRPLGLGGDLHVPAGGDEAALGAGHRALRHGPRAPPRRELPIDAARTFLRDQAWQPTRRYLERLAATADWAEVLFAANLCFEPTVATLIRRELGTRAAAASGDTVTPVLARVETQEWEWARAWTVALTRFLVLAEGTAPTAPSVDAGCVTGRAEAWAAAPGAVGRRGPGRRLRRELRAGRGPGRARRTPAEAGA